MPGLRAARLTVKGLTSNIRVYARVQFAVVEFEAEENRVGGEIRIEL